MPTFSYKDSQIYYDEYGTGTPIIFIHPPAMGRKVFHYQKQLRDNFRVVFPDLTGHGDTVGPFRDVSILGYAEEIRALLDHLKIDKTILCGYSSGGIVAQEFALHFPKQTLAVILAGGFPEVQSLAFKYEHQVGMYMVKNHPRVLAKLIANSHTKDKKIRQEIYQHMLKANMKTWYQFYKESLYYSCVDRLDNWTKPLLLMYGSRDLVNQHTRIYERYISFQSAVIQNVSHQIPTREWKLFNQIISGFINENL
jgi:pimeloyl-ACP methyl ester carboxylesterase